MMGILNRYIFRELVVHFLLALSVFLFVMMMGRTIQILELIVRRGVNVLDVLKMFFSLIPVFLPLSIPVATLIGSVVAFSRMSSDLEIVALKSSGISLYQIVRPVAVFSFTVTMICLVLTFHLAPWGARTFKTMALDVARRHIAGLFKEGVFHEITRGFVVYAQKVDIANGVIKGVFIHDRRSAKLPVVVVARTGRVPTGRSASGPLTLVLEDGEMLQSSLREGKLRRIRFKRYELNLDLPLAEAQSKIRGNTTNEKDLKDLIRDIRDPKSKGSGKGETLLEIHQRAAISLVCLIFGFLSLPLAMQTRPQGRSHGFVLGALAVFLYYVLFSMGKTMAETAHLPVWVCMWAPNLIFGALTVFMIQRTAQERQLGILLALNAVIERAQRIPRKVLGGGI